MWWWLVPLLLELLTLFQNWMNPLKITATAARTISTFGTFPRLFVNQNLHIAPHPLTGLRKFATLHSIYVVENVIANSSTAWIEAFAALHTTFSDTTQAIMDWINHIKLKIQVLVIARVSKDAIDSAFCGLNVITRLRHFCERQSSTATCWVACSDSLLCCNLERAFTWQELYNNISTMLAADLRFAEDNKTNTPKKTCLLTDGTAFFTAAHMNKAFYLGQNYKSTPSPTATAATGTTLQASKEGGKPNWRNVCPTCKITHPEGVKSCQHWELTTKATIERSKAKC
eukprot:1673216-Rhodomonas_salina.1